MRKKKEVEKMISVLATLLGKQVKEIEKHACYGKWAGTYDYCIRFTDGTSYFISNGFKNFEANLKKELDGIQYALSNKESIIKKLSAITERDKKVAEEKGVKSCTIKDIAIVTSDTYLGWAVLILDVDGVEQILLETGWNYALKSEEWLERQLAHALSREYFVAGGVKKPDFVFGNVGFSYDSYTAAEPDKIVA